MFLSRVCLLAVLILSVSCQSQSGVTHARPPSRGTSSGSAMQEKLTRLKFPMTRAELAAHIPAVGLEHEPRVLLDSASPHTKGTEYCRLGDGLTLVMPVDYKYSVSQSTASISALQVRTDADDVVKGAMIATAAHRGPAHQAPVCVNCSTDRYMKMLNAGL